MNIIGQINYDELNRQANSVLDGTIRINALSLAEEQGRNLGGKRNVEASLLLRGEIGTDGSKQGNPREQQEKILKEYALHERIFLSTLDGNRTHIFGLGNQRSIR